MYMLPALVFCPVSHLFMDLCCISSTYRRRPWPRPHAIPNMKSRSSNQGPGTGATCGRGRPPVTKRSLSSQASVLDRQPGADGLAWPRFVFTLLPCELRDRARQRIERRVHSATRPRRPSRQRPPPLRLVRLALRGQP